MSGLDRKEVAKRGGEVKNCAVFLFFVFCISI